MITDPNLAVHPPQASVPSSTAHHHHGPHDPHPDDAFTYPTLTQAGPSHTDEYAVETSRGYLTPSQDLPSPHHHHLQSQHHLHSKSATPTLAPPSLHENEKGGAESLHGRSPTETLARSASRLAEDEEKGEVKLKIVTWEEGDLENPRNWSYRSKWIRTATVSATCFIVALGSSLTVMDMDKAAEEFGASIDVVHLTITLFVLGFGVGALLFAPLSEMFGRRWPVIISMGLYFLFTFPSAFAQNVTALVVGRALAGLSASAPMCIIGGSLADLWSEEQRGRPLAVFSMTVFVGPIVGPVIAGYLTQEGWRANYYLLIALAGFGTILPFFLLPETYGVVLLRRRAVRLRKETGDPGFVTDQERFRRPFSEVMRISIVRPLQILVTEPIILFLTLYLCLIYALLYLLFFALPIVFGEIHGFPVGSVGLAFIPIAIGMFGAFFTVIPYQERHYAKVTSACLNENRPVPPEARLPAMLIGSITLPLGFFIFAWTSYERVHWIAPMIGLCLFGYSFIAIYVGANTYLVDSFPEYAASAMASKTFLSRLCGAAVPMFVDRYYHSRIGANWASCVLALTAVVMVPIPFGFYYYGARIRGMSKRTLRT